MNVLDTLIGSDAETIVWWQMCIRAVLLFFFGLILVRFGGKRVFGKNTSFDIVLGVILGSILSRALTANAKFLPTLTAAALLVVLHIALARAAFHRKWFGHLRVELRGSNAHLLLKQLRFLHLFDSAIMIDMLRRKAATTGHMYTEHAKSSGGAMLRQFVFGTLLVSSASVTCAHAQAPEAVMQDFTSFQSHHPYTPQLDMAADEAIVYGVDHTFRERVAEWRRQGYIASMMTGIAWGGYDAYYQTPDGFKKEEVQTTATGRLYMHGKSTTVGYNVPTPEYVEFIKNYIAPAIEERVKGIYLEEPEFWAETGWSEAFKRLWQDFYGEPWQAPDSSVDAQYRASKLKYELYFQALRDVFAFVDERAADIGTTIECIVPTHSLINYSQWRIVSPESHLIDIPALDGYVAQVWTGTARSDNVYQGNQKERTFETAYLEYGQMFGMVRPTGKKVWFLADPVEDNPNRSWNDYRRNYECTVIASLMWPEVHRYEVMPWPDRIFTGTYPKVDLDTTSGDRQGIPADYATELLAVINALANMNQPDVAYDTGTRGIGVIVSDTMMFQRAAPQPSDARLSSFYGLALPLVKAGVPVEIVQLENTLQQECLAPYKLLILTYEHQKPLKQAYHDSLTAWVREGGCLLFVEDGADPYHGVREWWNEQGTTNAKAFDDLFAKMNASTETDAPQAVGNGWVWFVRESPAALARAEDGATRVREWVGALLAKQGETLETQPYLCLRRGPFVVASVLDETVTDKPSLRLKGQYVNLFDASLPVLNEVVLEADQRALLYDLQWAREHGTVPSVAAAATRVRNEQASESVFRFVTRGPEGTVANMRVLLPREAVDVTTDLPGEVQWRWEDASSTAWISCANRAEDVTVSIRLK